MRNINGMKELVFKKFFSLIQSVMSEVAKFFMRMSLILYENEPKLYENDVLRNVVKRMIIHQISFII